MIRHILYYRYLTILFWWQCNLFLRSKKSSLILACDFPELGTLCTAMCRKLHIPVGTQKWPPHLSFAGVLSWSVNWYCLILKYVSTCHKTCGEHVSMWAGHASSSLCWFFLRVLSIQSPWGFAILCSQRWTLVYIHASTIAFIKIWANCPCLFYILTNTTLNRLGFGILIVGIATFWVHLLISSSRDRYM